MSLLVVSPVVSLFCSRLVLWPEFQYSLTSCWWYFWTFNSGLYFWIHSASVISNIFSDLTLNKMLKLFLLAWHPELMMCSQMADFSAGACPFDSSFCGRCWQILVSNLLVVLPMYSFEHIHL